MVREASRRKIVEILDNPTVCYIWNLKIIPNLLVYLMHYW